MNVNVVNGCSKNTRALHSHVEFFSPCGPHEGIHCTLCKVPNYPGNQSGENATDGPCNVLQQ